MKIGVITWCGGLNYGTNLQAYATLKAINKLGHNAKYISGFTPDKFGLKSKVKGLFAKLGILNRIKNFPNRNTQCKNVLRFLENDIQTIYVTSKSQYKQLLSDIPVFLAASDQIWNPDWTNDFLLLKFAGENKRISYASSFGVSTLPVEKKEYYTNALNKFQHISVRESEGVVIVKELIPDSDVVEVLDPTFLLEPSEWEDFSKDADKISSTPSKYMLVYLIGNNAFYKDYVKSLSIQNNNLEIVVISSAENRSFELPGAIVYKDGGPKEFVKLIQDAQFVCTDSFHACALSINLQKPFVVLKRFKDSEKISQNSRIYNLLNKFGFQTRLMDNLNYQLRPQSFDQSSEILQKERNYCIEYLRRIIEA